MYVAEVRRTGDTIDGLENVQRISAEPSRNTCGWFAPDSATILFASTAGKEVPDEPTAGYQREGRDYRWSYPSGMELHVAEPTWELERGTFEKRRLIGWSSSTRALTDNTFYDAEGSYSPDGKHIVFTSNRSGDLELYVMNADGSGVVQLTKTPGYDGGPFFSPDGKKLCYRSDRNGNDLLQVFVADLELDGQGGIVGLTSERALTDDGNVNWGPFWHPSGEWIVWSTSRHGHHNYEVYMMRADGGTPTRVTYSAGADVLPAFSPDGRHMVWSSKRTSDNTTQVFVSRFALPQK
jgi:Tol biopolymer transport system component